MCVTCGGALFYYGMGGTVEKGVVAGLLTYACPFLSSQVQHRLYDRASVVTFYTFLLSAIMNKCFIAIYSRTFMLYCSLPLGLQVFLHFRHM
jgi:hypothetical protein